MKLYDTLSKELKDIYNPKNMYICGPTVYNDIHIGNARPIIIFDVLYRLIKQFNVDFIYVRNITDVNDKITKHAIETGITASELATYYTNRFNTICKKLNTKQPDYIPKVSDYIDKIIEYIAELLNNGSAYIIQDGVYFDTKCVEYKYFRNDCNVESRLDNIENKKSNSDFVLWKLIDLPYGYTSPWGYGYPGWHIECSVMSTSILGTHFDIHGGGIDLQFPHHHNEIAQCMAHSKVIQADIWMHNEMVLVNDTKMSKSENNFWLVIDFLKSYHTSVIPDIELFKEFNLQDIIFYTEEYMGDVLRYMILSFHYQNVMNINSVQKAIDGVNKLRRYLFTNNIKYVDIVDVDNKRDLLYRLMQNSDQDTFINHLDNFYWRPLDHTEKTEYLSSLLDNLDTPRALQELFTIEEKDIYKFLLLIDVLGFKFNELSNISIIKIEYIYNEYVQAYTKQDYVRSDKLRDLLLYFGVKITGIQSPFDIKYCFI